MPSLKMKITLLVACIPCITFPLLRQKGVSLSDYFPVGCLPRNSARRRRYVIDRYRPFCLAWRISLYFDASSGWLRLPKREWDCGGSSEASEEDTEVEQRSLVSDLGDVKHSGWTGVPNEKLMSRRTRTTLPIKSELLEQQRQFSCTKWAKAYLINYILDKLQEIMGNIFILCSLSWIM
jgi:hypothetical protein